MGTSDDNKRPSFTANRGKMDVQTEKGTRGKEDSALVTVKLHTTDIRFSTINGVEVINYTAVQNKIDLLEQQKRFLKDDIKELEERKKYLEQETERQQQAIDRGLKEFEEVVKNKRGLLMRVGVLSMQDKSLDKREEKLKNREEYLEGKHQEVRMKFEQLQEQKARAIAVRDAQSSSYYKPTATEEEFFLEKRGEFLEAYEEYGNINKAAKECEIRPSLISYYKKKFPDFAGDMQIAYEVFKDKLDGELIDRAMNGQEKPSFYKGEVMDHYIEKNDGLMIAAAKAHIPEKYDRSKLDRIEGATQNNVVVNMISYNDIKPEDFGAIDNVGVVNFVGEHGDMKRITGDKFSQHEEAVDPAGAIIDVEVEDKQAKSVVFEDEDD